MAVINGVLNYGTAKRLERVKELEIFKFLNHDLLLRVEQMSFIWAAS